MEELIVRLVRATDAEDLQRYIFSRNTLDEVKERVARSLHDYDEDKAVRLVAEVAGHVVGTLIVIKREHPFYNHRCLLEDVVVNPDYHRRGIAKRLLEESRAYARQKGMTILEVSVRGGTPAETVYRRLGFMEYSRLPNGIIEPWGENCCFDEVFFYMPITD